MLRLLEASQDRFADNMFSSLKLYSPHRSLVLCFCRWHFSGGILNPASMKQALVEGAVPISDISMYEQGQGKLDLIRSKARLA